MRAAQHQTPGALSALAELCRNYWYSLCLFACRRGHPPEAIHARCEALVASEGAVRNAYCNSPFPTRFAAEPNGDANANKRRNEQRS
jgi:hypothetical protein